MKQPEIEPRGKKELAPSPGIVDALRGTISEPVTTISQKRGQEGQTVTVRLVENGSGQFGLTNREDNKEWAGIFAHSILSARYSVHLAEELLEANDAERIILDEGKKPNPQTILDAMVVSHAGRRRWDEANWYPDVAPDAEITTKISNETIGLQNIEYKVPQNAFNVVAALAHNLTGYDIDPDVLEGLNHKISNYVDHRTTQTYMPLNERMGQFLAINFFDKDTVTPDKQRAIDGEVQAIIDKRKKFQLGESTEDIDIQEADEIAARLGAKKESSRLDRKKLMELILDDADMEAMFIKAGIDPDNITDETVPMPQWEKNIRADYIEPAKGEIVPRIAELYEQIREGKGYDEAMKTLQQEFPLDTWWGNEAARLYMESQNPPATHMYHFEPRE